MNPDQSQHNTLLDLGLFGTPRRSMTEHTLKLKKLKEQLILYRALDAQEWQKQDRRHWRRPQTFSMGQAERVTKLSANDTARAVMEGDYDFEGSMSGASGGLVGPRGILRALSVATATPAPGDLLAKSGKSGDASSSAAAALGTTTDEQLQKDQKNEERISELELRKVRLEFKEMVRRQREEEARVQELMFASVRPRAASGAASSSQQGTTKKSSNEEEDDDDEEFFTSGESKKDKNKKKQQLQESTGEKKKSAAATTSARPVTSSSSRRQSTRSPPKTGGGDSARSARIAQRSQQQEAKRQRRLRHTDGNDISSSESDYDLTAAEVEEKKHRALLKKRGVSPARATTSLAELTHEATSSSPASGSRRRTSNFTVEPPKAPAAHQFASRARLYQFNAFRSNGISGMMRAVSAQSASSRPATAPTASSNNNTSNNSKRAQQEAEEEAAESERRRQRCMEGKPSVRGGVSAHPTLRPDTASKMFSRVYGSEQELSARKREIETAERESREAAAEFEAEAHQQQHQYDAAAAKLQKEQQHQQQQLNAAAAAGDPVIEINDPFKFLVDGAQAIHAGASDSRGITKREYSLSLQEKLLSLAAAHAGVSLNAAAAPTRVLGTRPPTAEAQREHVAAVERSARRARTAAAVSGSASGSLNSSVNNNRNHLDDSTTAIVFDDEYARSVTPRRTVTNVAGNLHAASRHLNERQRAAAELEHHQQQLQSNSTPRYQQAAKRPAPPQHKKGDFCNEAPLPFGRAGPIERHIPSPRIHPLAANSARQERSLCDNVHLASRTPSVVSYRPPPVQFAIPSWAKVTSVRAAANAGLMSKVVDW